VSDSPQGEGWWQASDGKWYPPQQHPGTPWYSLPPQVSAPVEPQAKPWWRHWWVPVAGGVILLGAVGAAFGEEQSERSTEPAAQGVGSTEKEAAGTSPSDELGTRQNPHPIGETGVFTVRALGDADYSVWSLVVDEPGTDITQLVASENMFNPSPDDGSLFFGVPVSLTLVEAGKEPLDTFWNIDFGAMGKSSMSLSDIGFFGCGVVPNSFDRNQQVFIGGTLTGVLCFEVSEADFEAGVMLTVDERDRVFLDAGPSDISAVSQDTLDSSDASDGSGAPSDESARTSTPEAAENSPNHDAGAEVGAAGSFSSESRFGGYTWNGVILGYVLDSANSLSDDDVQACVSVVGTISPTIAEEHGLTSGGSTPEFSLLVDGLLVESSMFGCDNDRARDAGYSTLFLEQMTAGSEFPFFASFELPNGLTEPDGVEVIVGDPDSNSYQRIDAAQLDALPQGEFVGAPLPLDAVRPAGTVVSHYDSDSQWEVIVDGVVVLDAVGRKGGGSCVIVLGTMTPTDTGGALVADGSDTPLVGIVVDGLSRGSDFFSCQDAAAEEAGYGDPDDADVAVGTPYHFYDVTYLPASVSVDVEAVSIGLAMFDDITLVGAPLLDSIPVVQ